MTVVSRGTGAVAGLVMAAAVLAGCSSSDEEDGPPGGAESPGTSSSAPTSPTTSASPSEDPTPEVTATGPEVTLEGEGGGKSFTFTTPDKRWTVGVGTSQLITVKGGNYIEGYVISVPGTRDIDSYIRDQNDLYKSRGFKLERGEDLHGRRRRGDHDRSQQRPGTVLPVRRAERRVVRHPGLRVPEGRRDHAGLDRRGPGQRPLVLRPTLDRGHQVVRPSVPRGRGTPWRARRSAPGPAW